MCRITEVKGGQAKYAFYVYMLFWNETKLSVVCHNAGALINTSG